MTILFNRNVSRYTVGDFGTFQDTDENAVNIAQSYVDCGYATIVVPAIVEPIKVNDSWSEPEPINKKK